MGYYRLTIVSDKQFNITCADAEGVVSKGVNTVIVYSTPKILFEFSPVDPTLVRVKFKYVLEYLGP